MRLFGISQRAFECSKVYLHRASLTWVVCAHQQAEEEEDVGVELCHGVGLEQAAEGLEQAFEKPV